MLKIGTDCSGINAPLHALDLLGIKYEYLFGSDICKFARQSAQANHDCKKMYTDIYDRDHNELPKVDLYIAGFPCQTFSSLGKRNGFADPRGTIFRECIKTIKACQPDVYILENVKGLTTHDKGRTFKTVLQELNELPYTLDWHIYNTKDYNLPQSRNRVYIVGTRNGATFKRPPILPLTKSIHDILEKNVTDAKPLTEHQSKVLDSLNLSEEIDYIVDLDVSSAKWARSAKEVCPCIHTNSYCFYSTSVHRRLTARELLRLQGFPDSFKIAVSNSKLIKQIGNSMSVNVLCAIIGNIDW
jgi:DNA (cytosine-5)-methyltransferase 1